jgi:hypothetical protein
MIEESFRRGWPVEAQRAVQVEDDRAQTALQVRYAAIRGKGIGDHKRSLKHLALTAKRQILTANKCAKS